MSFDEIYFLICSKDIHPGDIVSMGPNIKFIFLGMDSKGIYHRAIEDHTNRASLWSFGLIERHPIFKLIEKEVK